MKKLILLSILLIIGCDKSSTSSEPSCTELIKTYTDAASAFSADNTNQELCDASMTAYLAVIDAECTGYTDLSQSEINFISTMCDNFLETEAGYGCTNPDAVNYDSNATAACDNDSHGCGSTNCCCTDAVSGCTHSSATNYNPLATVDDGSCEYSTVGCTDPNAYNYNVHVTTPCNSGTDNDCCEYSISGCTDINANNYNQSATTPCNSGTDNDCCEY